MNWDYSNVVPASAPQPAPMAAPETAPAPKTLTPADMDRIRQGPPELQTAVAGLLTQGLDTQSLTTEVYRLLDAFAQPPHPAQTQPIQSPAATAALPAPAQAVEAPAPTRAPQRFSPAAQAEAEQVNGPRLVYQDMGPTTAAIAAQGANGFTPSNVPDVRQNRGIGRVA